MQANAAILAKSSFIPSKNRLGEPCYRHEVNKVWNDICNFSRDIKRKSEPVGHYLSFSLEDHIPYRRRFSSTHALHLYVWTRGRVAQGRSMFEWDQLDNDLIADAFEWMNQQHHTPLPRKKLIIEVKNTKILASNFIIINYCYH